MRNRILYKAKERTPLSCRFLNSTRCINISFANAYIKTAYNLQWHWSLSIWRCCQIRAVFALALPKGFANANCPYLSLPWYNSIFIPSLCRSFAVWPVIKVGRNRIRFPPEVFNFGRFPSFSLFRLTSDVIIPRVWKDRGGGKYFFMWVAYLSNVVKFKK